METSKKSNSKMVPSDRDLLARFVAMRDEASFRLLVARHGGLVSSVCRRMLPCQQDREDVFQATFLKLLVYADRNTWHETLGGWLHKVAYHLSLKASAARSFGQSLESVEEPWMEDTCFAEIQRQDLERALHEAIAQLPNRDREAIVLYYFRKLSRAQAAAEMGCSLSTFKNLLQRGRSTLYMRLSCRGLSCSLALVSLEQALTASTVCLPELIDKAVFLGFNHQAGGGAMSSSPRIEELSQKGSGAMFQSSLANNILTTLSCYSIVFMGSVGWLHGTDFSGLNSSAQMTSLFAWQPYEVSGPADSAFVSGTGKEKKRQSDVPARTDYIPPVEATDAEIAKLIEQLGAKKAEERHAAAKNLKVIGDPALAQLLAAAKGKHKGIASRAQLILDSILRHQAQRKEELAMKDFLGGKTDVELSGWNRYQKIVGDTHQSRAFFAKMQQSESDLLNAYELTPEKAAAAFSDSVNEFRVFRYEKGAPGEFPQPQGFVSTWNKAENLNAPVPSTEKAATWIAALLLVAGDERIKLQEDTEHCLGWYLKVVLDDSDKEVCRIVKEAISQDVAKPIIEKLLANWLLCRKVQELTWEAFDIQQDKLRLQLSMIYQNCSRL